MCWHRQDGADQLCRQLVDDSQLTPRLKALRARELARGLDPELLRRFVLYVRRYRFPVSAASKVVCPCCSNRRQQSIGNKQPVGAPELHSGQAQDANTAENLKQLQHIYPVPVF